MASKKRVLHAREGAAEEPRSSLAATYPTIALWASGYGWVEFGIDGLDRPFARALDEGGIVWEGQALYESLDEALGDMEERLTRFMEEEGFIRTPSARPKSHRGPGKILRKSKGGSVTKKHPAEGNPVSKTVGKLDEIAEALRRGERFSVTRLTVLKGLCEDAGAAGAFALFLIRKVQRKMRHTRSEKRHRALVNRSVREVRSYLDDPSEERRDRLSSLFHEIVGEQDEYRNASWGAVRIIHSMDLLVAEKAVRAVLRPAEAPSWLYQAARDYAERYNARYGDGLIPDSAPLVEDIAGFWRRYHGIKR
jgi:hypothetical protein